jgi:16S rRNA processing protein RimM
MGTSGDNGSGAAGRVIIGRISGVYGTAGWVRVFSYTRPRENICSYSPWLVATPDGWEERELLETRVHGKGLIARLAGPEDRDAARALIDRDIAVYRRQLPALPEGEYYWCDLIGRRVVNLGGEELGEVTEIRETGANDVLVVEDGGRRLIPLVMEKVVREVDPAGDRIVVDWDGD